MNLLTIKNESPMKVNMATFNNGKLKKCFNNLAPGEVVNIESLEQEWQYFIVMASEGNKNITTQDKLNDVVNRSIDSACRSGVLSSKFRQGHFNKNQNAIFASILLNS